MAATLVAAAQGVGRLLGGLVWRAAAPEGHGEHAQGHGGGRQGGHVTSRDGSRRWYR